MMILYDQYITIILIIISSIKSLYTYNINNTLLQHLHPVKYQLKNCGKTYVKDLSSRLRIIGGKEATKGRWPWQVVLLNTFHEAYCGGTILTSTFVITAAHCIRRRMYIRAGEHNLLTDEGTEQEMRIDNIFIHPNYDQETVDSDIALIKLRTPLKFNKYISNICLPPSKSKLKVNKRVTILGWGKRKNSAFFGTNILHQAIVPIANISDCRNVYEDYFISNNMICAGYRTGKVDSCAGDSGGPLLSSRKNKWYIYGITSFGEGCGRKGKYGIYAKVANFVKWIRKTIIKHSAI